MSTKIEWTQETWNPVTGCTKVSQGCKHCYAERLFPRVYAKTGRTFTDVRCHPERLDAPLHWKKPRRIFVNSMSDLFHEDVPLEFVDDVFRIMALADWHTFQVLTKRPERMRAYLVSQPSQRVHTTDTEHIIYTVPSRNVWLGVSVEDQASADERIPLLLQTPAAVRFLSCEPLLGPIDLSAHLGIAPNHDDLRGLLNWVIAGGESGPKARPSHPDWFRSLRDQCAAAGVPFFFKQWGEWRPTDPKSDGLNLRSGWASPFAHTDLARRLGSYASDKLPGMSKGPATLEREGFAFVDRVGKKAAGRTLDGRLHNEYPA